MASYISIVKGLVDMGYLPAGLNRKQSVRKNPRKTVIEFMQTMGFNLIINNVPTFSTPKESTETEQVDECNVFETLAEFGSPHCVLKVTPECYMAYALDAENIKDELDGMMIDNNVLTVKYNPVALPLEIKSASEVCVNTGTYDFTRVLLQFFILICAFAGVFYLF